MKRILFSLLALLGTAAFLSGCQQQMSFDSRTVAIEITVPDPAWSVQIEEIYARRDKLLVISSLNRDPEVMAAQVISRVSDSVKVQAPDLPVEHYVLGKTFGWAQEPYHFIKDRDEIAKKLKDATRIYRRTKDRD